MSRVTVSATSLWNVLIRTHHITSRKKVAKLRQAANDYEVYVLICYGGCPGVMYTEGSCEGVKQWVEIVRRLRYKDYQLAIRPAPLVVETQTGDESTAPDTRTVPIGLNEVETVKDFGAVMRERNVWCWWRKGMGYVSDQE